MQYNSKSSKNNLNFNLSVVSTKIFLLGLWDRLHQQPSSPQPPEQDEDIDYADILKSFLFDQQKCPNGRFLSAIPGGNLGNLIWEYMSLYAIAHLFGKKYNLVPYVNPTMKKSIESVFDT